MPDIGRFFNVDKLAEKYYYNSPYAFSGNHVVAHRELEGLEKVQFMAALATPNERDGVQVVDHQIIDHRDRVKNTTIISVREFSSNSSSAAIIDLSAGSSSDRIDYEYPMGMAIF